MQKPEPLAAEQLYNGCNADELPFSSTDELDDLTETIGQDRAVDALRFGTGIRDGGYNLFMLGSKGSGMLEVAQRFLRKRAKEQESPSDWCYVNNFEQQNQPVLLRFDAGGASLFRTRMDQLLEELRTAIPAVFDSDEYHNRLQELQQSVNQRQEEAFQDIQHDAEQQDIALIATPNGFTLAPRKDGEVMDPEAYHKLPQEERQRIEAIVARLQARIQSMVQQLPRWRKEIQENIKQLNDEMAQVAVGHLIDELAETYRDHQGVLEHLDNIRKDVVENATALIGQGKGGDRAEQVLHRYRTNVLVDNSGVEGAPVVYEDLPSYQRLVGRVEHHMLQGALITDFTLIKPGALHRANGGFLIVDARKILTQPFAWETLKRALTSRQLHIESLEHMYSLISTITLEPSPVPLDVKVVLVGERMLYYLLAAYDPDFRDLFKVQADFEDDMVRDTDHQLLYARQVATVARERNLLPLDRSAVARLIEHASRLSEDSGRISTDSRALQDLMTEANYFAARERTDRVTAREVEKAINKQIYRAQRIHERMDQQILDGTLLIETGGTAVGTINGLSVIQLGDYRFGRPSRITATARLGRGQVVDIEREVKLGGAIHSKGVMILSSFLGSHYATNVALSLHASLVFEQSYGMVDGDSASLAELCALLSALGDAPIRQVFAVTGSVNQRGQVQAIGGVNEKIEGFFEICKQRGFTEDQGVLIPASNVRHLMLDNDVRSAVGEGRFHIYPVTTVDEAMALLTGCEPGQRNAEGRFPEDTVNWRVEKRLEELAALQHQEKQNEDRANDHGTQ